MQNEVSAQAPMLLLDEFLVAAELNSLLGFALTREPDFTQTQVVGSKNTHHTDNGYRRSRVLYELDWYRDLFIKRITAFAPHVFRALAYPTFPIGKVETQLTSTRNGEFFRRHSDNGASSVRGRRITFVYFFYREPRPFSGGELRIYNTRRDSEASEAAYTTIMPLQNQIIFFLSDYIHEIIPVQGVSDDFADSRFTVNGWLHQ